MAHMVTRRVVLGTGIASALSWLVSPPRLMGRAAGVVRGRDGAELYAFPGRRPATTVIALTWPKHQRGALEDSEVRIHNGSQSWKVEIPAKNAEWEENQTRLFFGRVYWGDEKPQTDRQALVMETPNQVIAGTAPIGIWAERFARGGTRHRIGSPFMAKILAENETMAEMYHAISPCDDRRVLTEGVVKAIASKAQGPNAYGRRLASLVLPDVLRYDPALPLGFTFAAQNGRHPFDASEVVVHSILSGSPTAVSVVAVGRLQQDFPYFASSRNII